MEGMQTLMVDIPPLMDEDIQPVMEGNLPVMEGNLPVMEGNLPVMEDIQPVMEGNLPVMKDNLDHTIDNNVPDLTNLSQFSVEIEVQNIFLNISADDPNDLKILNIDPG